MDAFDEEWQLLTTFLPKEWREMACTEGAIQRKRSVKDPDELLRLLLLHAATGLSLRQSVARAAILGWPSMSDVALLKRLRSSGTWLKAMAAQMLAASRFSAGLPPGFSEKRTIRAVDATTIQEPGATGTSWRVHYSITLPGAECDFYELTDVKGGESYKRFPVSKGDLILADRGYSNRAGVAHVIRLEGDVLVRLNSTSFPLLVRDGQAFDVLEALRNLEGHTPGEWPVSFKYENETFEARLCAIRKSMESAELAKRRLVERARRKGSQTRPETTEYAEYVVVLTTLPSDSYSVSQILELYRLRWQIELVFKRLKSLMQLGHVPKRTDQSARSWIQAKMLVALLIERISAEARFFSPWGFTLQLQTIPLA